jgi:hypothetical protein
LGGCSGPPPRSVTLQRQRPDHERIGHLALQGHGSWTRLRRVRCASDLLARTGGGAVVWMSHRGQGLSLVDDIVTLG